MCWVLRIFLLSLGILSLVAGVYCLTHAFRLHRSIENMKVPHTFFPVDLSQSLQQHDVGLPCFGYYFFHGFNLILETNADFVSKEEGEKLLEGLQGKLTIKNKRSTYNIEFTKDDFFCVPYSNYVLKRTRFESIDFYRGETESCHLSIAIYQGALNLKGIEQTLKIRCSPYGSESLLLLICTILGACLTIIGFGIIILFSIHISKKVKTHLLALTKIEANMNNKSS
jgi:hypothetical protein